MNFTSKSHYALKIMLDLSCYSNLPHVNRKDISMRQSIPMDYLDQIMIRLRAGKLVDSIRGRGGGYKLARSAKEISIWDVVTAVEEGIGPVPCTRDLTDCKHQSACISSAAWHKVFESVKTPLIQMTLENVIENWLKEHDHSELDLDLKMKEEKTTKQSPLAVPTPPPSNGVDAPISTSNPLANESASTL